MTTDHWWEDYSNIVILTGFMADQDYPVSEVARAVEKPWNYSTEFVAAIQELEAG